MLGHRENVRGANNGGPQPSKALRKIWIFTLCLSLSGWIAFALFHAATTAMDANGFIHEPLFGLIPVSFVFLLITAVLASFDLARVFKRHRALAKWR